jgi:hypothetical protein
MLHQLAAPAAKFCRGVLRDLSAALALLAERVVRMPPSARSRRPEVVEPDLSHLRPEPGILFEIQYLNRCPWAFPTPNPGHPSRRRLNDEAGIKPRRLLCCVKGFRGR